jgi:hypothetical protein
MVEVRAGHATFGVVRGDELHAPLGIPERAGENVRDVVGRANALAPIEDCLFQSYYLDDLGSRVSVSIVSPATMAASAKNTTQRRLDFRGTGPTLGRNLGVRLNQPSPCLDLRTRIRALRPKEMALIRPHQERPL